MPSRKITLPDVVLFVTLILLTIVSAALMSSGSHGESVLLSADGWESTYPLGADGEFHFTSNGIDYVLEIKESSAAIVEAGCPDGICKKSGRITSVGESIVCIPGRVSVTIVGEDVANEADYIIG